MKDEEDFDYVEDESGEDIEELEEADEIEPEEEGFLEGYEEEANPAQCANCGKVLGKKFVEEEIKGKTYRFCSERCADKFEIKKEHT